MSNRRDIQFTYNPHNKATILDCNFVVDSTNGNGDGIRSLKKSGRVNSVYMHTSATPSAGNPNPAAGYIVVNLQDNYNRYLGGYGGMASPVSGTPIVVTAAGAHLVVGNVYIITLLGTTTAADWQAVGVPSYIVPAVGVAFVAKATGAGVGSGVVMVPKVGGSGIDHIEAIGDANLMNSYGAHIIGSGNGMTLILSCLSAGVLTAPNDGSVIGLNFYMNNSAQGV